SARRTRRATPRAATLASPNARDARGVLRPRSRLAADTAGRGVGHLAVRRPGAPAGAGAARRARKAPLRRGWRRLWPLCGFGRRVHLGERALAALRPRSAERPACRRPPRAAR